MKRQTWKTALNEIVFSERQEKLFSVKKVLWETARIVVSFKNPNLLLLILLKDVNGKDPFSNYFFFAMILRDPLFVTLFE